MKLIKPSEMNHVQTERRFVISDVALRVKSSQSASRKREKRMMHHSTTSLS